MRSAWKPCCTSSSIRPRWSPVAEDPWFTAPMSGVGLLAKRVEEAGFAVASLEEVTGGFISVAGAATLRDGGRVFVKTLAEGTADMFEVEAAGLSALCQLGGVRVPAVIHVSQRLLVLEALRPRREDERFWEQLAHMVATLHTSTACDRFGWHRDGWQGRMRQDNTWETDGYAFLRAKPHPAMAAPAVADPRRPVAGEHPRR